MKPSVPPVPVPLLPMLPPALRHWVQPLEPALWRLLVPCEVLDGFNLALRAGTGVGFAQHLLDALAIQFKIDDCDRKRVPAGGPAVIVANHPYGIVEGLILAALLDRVRPDWKIMVNSMLAGIAELRAHMISVNPSEVGGANAENRAPLRESMRLLSAGGALVMFPAGEVAHLNWTERSINDPFWKTTAARLALRCRSPVVPVFFDGANSMPFHVAGVIHPGLRTIGLAREFHNMRGKTVHLRIGRPILHSVLNGYRDPEHATAYMRSRTLFLANRSAAAPLQSTTYMAGKRARAIEPSGCERLLSEEVAALPPESELADNRAFAVYMAAADAIPRLLAEIGRCRELAISRYRRGYGKRD